MSNHRDYIYLASPYNHPDDEIRIFRVEEVSQFGFDLTEAGLNVFCPITQSYNLQNAVEPSCLTCTGDSLRYKQRGRKLTHEEWMRVDLAFLSKAKLLVVYSLRGWAESKGVREEISYAEANGIPVVYATPRNDFLMNLSQIKVALGLEDVKEGKVQEKEWKATHDFDVARKEILEKFEDYKPPVHEREKMKTILKEVTDDTPPAPQEFPDEFDSVREGYEMLGINDLQKDKGVKAEEAKNKPTTLNFPWKGYHLDTIGKYMARIIADIPGTAWDYTQLVDDLYYLEDSLSRWLNYPTDLQINEIFVKGMQKHGLRTHLNYDKVDIELLVDAMGRHILKGLDNLDEESGLPHIHHVMANIYMIRQIVR